MSNTFECFHVLIYHITSTQRGDLLTLVCPDPRPAARGHAGLAAGRRGRGRGGEPRQSGGREDLRQTPASAAPPPRGRGGRRGQVSAGWRGWWLTSVVVQGPRAGVRGRGLPSLATLQPLLLPPGRRQQPGLGRRPASAGQRLARGRGQPRGHHVRVRRPPQRAV